MKPKQYSSEGVILARRDFSEADRILTVYTQNYGKLSLIAKGIKRPESKKRGSLEVFNRVKFSAVEGKAWDIMTEVEIVDPFKNIRHDLKKISVAYYLIEVVNKTTRDEEKHEDLYDLLIASLKKVENENGLTRIRKEFVYDLLVTLGYWPEGRDLLDPDLELERVIERKLSSVRVGKKVLSS